MKHFAFAELTVSDGGRVGPYLAAVTDMLERHRLVAGEDVGGRARRVGIPGPARVVGE